MANPFLKYKEDKPPNPFLNITKPQKEVSPQIKDNPFLSYSPEQQDKDFMNIAIAGNVGLGTEILKDEEMRKSAKEIGKASVRGMEGIGSGVGAAIKWYGETLGDKKPTPFGLPIPTMDIESEKELFKKIGTKIADFGEGVYDKFKELQQSTEIGGVEIAKADPEIFSGSFMENPSWTRGVAAVAQAIPSLATATAITFATKSPVMGAASLGFLEGAGQYQEAREADKSVQESSKYGLLSSVGNTLLETIPLTRFFRGGSKKLGKDIFIGAVQEGGEEVLQGLWSNMIARVGYDKTRVLTEGLVESFIGGAGSGGMLGGITSGKGQQVDAIAQEAIDKGMSFDDVNKMMEAVKNQLIANSVAVDEAITENVKHNQPIDIPAPTEEKLEFEAKEVESLETEAKKFKTAEEFVESKLEKKGERIVSSAVVVEGKVFTAPLHGEAIEKASKDTGLSVDEIVEGQYEGKTFIDSFITNKGRVLDRFEASKEFGITSGEDLEKRNSQLTSIWKKAQGKVEPSVPSKEIISEKVIRRGELTKEEREAYPDLQEINDELSKIEGKKETESIIKRKEELYKRLGATTETIKTSKIKQIIDKSVGIKKLADTITLREDVALRAQLRMESKVAKQAESEAKRLTKEQERIKKQVSAVSEKLFNLSKRDLPQEYKDIIDDQLDSLGLSEKVRPLRARNKLSAFVQEQIEKGETMPLSESEINLVDDTDLRNVTLDLLERKYEVLKQVAHLGSIQNKLIEQKQQEDFDKVVNDIVSSVKLPRKDTGEYQGLTGKARQKNKVETLIDGIHALGAGLRKIEFVARTLDNFKYGKVQQYTTDKFNRANDKEMIDNEKDFMRLRDAIINSKIDLKNMYDEIIEVNYNDDVKNLRRVELLGVYVNSKNEGNLRRLREGWGLGDEQIVDAISRMTDNEKSLGDAILRLVSHKWDATNEIKMALTGKRLGKIDGYFPIVTDRELDVRKQLREAEIDLFQTVMNRTFVEKGFTKTREGGISPVDLDAFRVVMNHISGVNHYNSHALAVRDVQKIIADPKIKEMITSVMNDQIYNQFPQWLRSVANPRKVINPYERFARGIRTNATAAMLGFKTSVSLVQGGSFTQTVDEIGEVSAITGLIEFYKHPHSITEFIYEHSPQLKFREKTFDREVRDSISNQRIQGKLKGNKSMIDVLFFMIKAVDKATTLPSWYGAYLKQMKTTNGDIADSVQYADGVVRRTQPTGAVKDLPQIMKTNEFLKLFTMFYSHFTNYHNRMVQTYDYMKLSDEPVIKKSATAVRSFWWNAVAPGLLAVLLRSAGAEKRPKKYIEGVLSYLFAGMPLVRDIANVWGRDITSPAFAGFSEAKQLYQELYRPIKGKTWKGKRIRPERIIERAVKISGYIFGLPAQQAWVTYTGIMDLKDGDTSDYRRLLLSKYQLGEK